MFAGFVQESEKMIDWEIRKCCSLGMWAKSFFFVQDVIKKTVTVCAYFIYKIKSYIYIIVCVGIYIYIYLLYIGTLYVYAITYCVL